jgi:hypothetical protein
VVGCVVGVGVAGLMAKRLQPANGINAARIAARQNEAF